LDPYEVDQLLEAMRSQSRLSVPGQFYIWQN